MGRPLKDLLDSSFMYFSFTMNIFCLKQFTPLFTFQECIEDCLHKVMR